MLMFEWIGSIYNTVLFYGAVLLLDNSPGELAWKLFKNKKGKLRLIYRDLICDTKTLFFLPKNELSLDEFTTDFSPFTALLTLSGPSWKLRRKILSDGLRKIDLDKPLNVTFPFKKGDVYWDFYEMFFRVGFEKVFSRSITPSEFSDMYPGIVDINRIIKKQVGVTNTTLRRSFYQRVVALLEEKGEGFIFANNQDFHALDELHRVSIVVEDLLTSICIQCTDLICHLLVLYPTFQENFKDNLDHCINETLRLYPLTDIWARKPNDQERPWIASLVQLNRNGWEEPDTFNPDRWHTNDHPPLVSWGFDARSCPATRIGYNLTKKVFEKLVSTENLWIKPASNFKHSRTFLDGCQLWIGTGTLPSSQWKYSGRLKRLLKRWFFTKLRILQQWELW